MATQRIVITVTEDMHEAITQEALKRSNTMSAITRLALAEWLADHGYSGDWTVQYGPPADVRPAPVKADKVELPEKRKKPADVRPAPVKADKVELPEKRKKPAFDELSK